MRDVNGSGLNVLRMGGQNVCMGKPVTLLRARSQKYHTIDQYHRLLKSAV